MNKSLVLPLSLSLIALAGCQVPLAFQDPVTARETPAWNSSGRFGGEVPAYVQAQPANGQPANPQSMNAPTGGMSEGEAALLDWGGGVVQSPAQGEIRRTNGAPTHGLQESVEGRMHIIELYQSVLDERDQLLTEVEALQAALTNSQGMLQAEKGVSATLSTRAEALEEAKRVLMEDNAEIASRLTTAQIRRLEAEKLLLETQVAWHREKIGSSPTTPVSNYEQPK